MPAIAIYSAALNNAPNKVLVETSDTTEDASGIVRVGVTYIAKSADAEAVSKTMVLDSEPPAYPNTVFRDQLQRRRLYQYQRTIEQQYGIAKIRGYYAGVLNRGQVPQIQSETETLSFSVELTLEDITRLTNNYNFDRTVEFALGEGAGRQSFFSYNNERGARGFCTFTFSGRSTILRRSFGALVNSTNPPSTFTTVTADQLLLNLSCNAFFQYDEIKTLVKNVFGVSPSDDFARSRTPIEWLRAFSRCWRIDGDFNTEYITPTVVVISGESRIRAEDSRETLVSIPPLAT